MEKLTQNLLEAIDCLPDEAMVEVNPANGYYYASIRLDRRYPSDPDFTTCRRSRREALIECSTRIRRDLNGIGKYAPHFTAYRVEYRLLPFWQAMAKGLKT